MAQVTGMIKFVNPENRITLEGKAAKPEDIKVGRRGKINYFVRDELNRVRSIELEGGTTG